MKRIIVSLVAVAALAVTGSAEAKAQSTVKACFPQGHLSIARASVPVKGGLCNLATELERIAQQPYAHLLVHADGHVFFAAPVPFNGYEVYAFTAGGKVFNEIEVVVTTAIPVS